MFMNENEKVEGILTLKNGNKDCAIVYEKEEILYLQTNAPVNNEHNILEFRNFIIYIKKMNLISNGCYDNKLGKIECIYACYLYYATERKNKLTSMDYRFTEITLKLTNIGFMFKNLYKLKEDSIELYDDIGMNVKLTSDFEESGIDFCPYIAKENYSKTQKAVYYLKIKIKNKEEEFQYFLKIYNIFRIYVYIFLGKYIRIDKIICSKGKISYIMGKLSKDQFFETLEKSKISIFDITRINLDKKCTFSDFVKVYKENEEDILSFFDLELAYLKYEVNKEYIFLHYEYQNRFNEIMYIFEQNNLQIQNIIENLNDNQKQFYDTRIKEYLDISNNKDKGKEIKKYTNKGKLFIILTLYHVRAFNIVSPLVYFEEHLTEFNDVIRICQKLLDTRNCFAHKDPNKEKDILKAKKTTFDFVRDLHTILFWYFKKIDIYFADMYVSRNMNNTFSILENDYKNFKSNNEWLIEEYKRKNESQ